MSMLRLAQRALALPALQGCGAGLKVGGRPDCLLMAGVGAVGSCPLQSG